MIGDHFSDHFPNINSHIFHGKIISKVNIFVYKRFAEKNYSEKHAKKIKNKNIMKKLQPHNKNNYTISKKDSKNSNFG